MQTSRLRSAACLCLAVLLFGLGISAGIPQQARVPAEKLVEVADSLIPVVTRIRGLNPKAPIQKGAKSRAEITQYIVQEIDKHNEKGRLRNEGLLLQKLGLIPADLDYTAFTLKLLSEQVGGYYDPDAKSFFIAGWLSVDEQKPAMVHELTHALQDQYFDLKGMMERDRKAQNDDATLAHQALGEGDATAVMLDYMLQPTGKNFLDLPNLVQLMRLQVSLMNDQFEVLKKAPVFIKDTLIFPYSYGTAFLQQIRSHGESWSAVNKIYADLPSSTEQIIHPEKYVARDNPKTVEIEDPAPKLGKDWQLLKREVLGEFFLYELLKSQLPEDAAQSASKGWGGDRMALVGENGTDKIAVFVDTAWDDTESADRFFGAMSNFLEKRHAQGQKVRDSADGFGIVSAGEYSSVRRHGSNVRFIIGLPESLADKVDEK